MSYLIKVTEEHHVDTEAEAARLIEDAKRDSRFTLLKSTTTYKTIKERKEIVDEYWMCTLVKEFTDAKYPEVTVSVEYTVDQGVFPSPVTNDNYNDEEGGMF